MKEDIFHLGIKAIIRNAQGEVLLLQVDHTKLINEPNDYWDIPGGRVHKGVSIEATLYREVEEETGIINLKSFLLFTAALANFRIPAGNDSVGLILFAYLCDVDETGEIKLSGEHISYGWFSSQKAAQLLNYKYPPEFIQKIRDLNAS